MCFSYDNFLSSYGLFITFALIYAENKSLHSCHCVCARFTVCAAAFFHLLFRAVKCEIYGSVSITTRTKKNLMEKKSVGKAKSG